MSGIMRGETWTVDIPPGSDLLEQLERFLEKRHVKLAAVLSGIGMLENAQLKLTNGKTSEFEEPVELLSASGTVRREDKSTIANISVIVGKNGKLFAGKLLPGCIAAAPDRVTLFLSVIGEATQF